MEIDNNNPASVATRFGGQSAAVENQRNSKDTPPADTQTSIGAGTDKVSLTGQAQQLQELEMQLANQPVVDKQRVESVRNAIENGSFTVKPGRIADRLISLDQALSKPR